MYQKGVDAGERALGPDAFEENIGHFFLAADRWDKAQPFRLIAHDGEINSIAGNRSWAARPQTSLQLGVWAFCV